MAAMRGNQGRCPPFLVAGLAVFCFVLMYNYWSVSSQNYDLYLEMEELQSKVKFLSGKQIQVETDDKLIKVRLEESEDKIGKYHVEINKLQAQLKKDREAIATLKNDNENIQQSLVNCRDEAKHLEALTSTNDEDKVKLQNEKENIAKEMQVKNDKLVESQKKEEEFAKTVNQLRNEIQQLRREAASIPFSVPEAKRHLESTPDSIKGVNVHIKSTDGMKYYSSPIIVFESPDTPKATARFSVADIESGKITTPSTPKKSTTTVAAVIGKPLESSVIGKPPEAGPIINEEDRESEHKNILEKPHVINTGKKEKAKLEFVLAKPGPNLDAQEDDANADGLTNLDEPDQAADGTLDDHQTKDDLKSKPDHMNKDPNELHLEAPASKQDPIEDLAENLVQQDRTK